MSLIPAICSNTKCGAVFSSGLNTEGVQTTFVGCEVGYCPKCGSLGRIPDGEYSAISNTLYANLKNIEDISILIKLQEIIKTSVKNNDFSSTKSQLADYAPAWSNVWGLLPEKDITASISIYMFILALLQTAITLYSLSKPIEQKIFINQSYQFFYDSSPRIYPPDIQQSRQEKQLNKPTRPKNKSFKPPKK